MVRMRFDRTERIRIAAVGLAVVATVAATRVSAFIGDLNRVADEMTLDSGPQATLLYDRQGRQIFSLFAEARVARPLDQMSPHVATAVLAAEDRGFLEHQGV